MAYLGNVPVEKFLGGISRFQKHVYPKHQDLFERLAMGQRPEALFITCADSRIDPCLITQTKPGELFICRVIGNVIPPYPDAIGGDGQREPWPSRAGSGSNYAGGVA